MKGLVGGIPIALLAAAAHAQPQSQAQGRDVGSSAAIPSDNTASTAVSEEYNGDHSFELDNDVNTSPPGFGHWGKRTPGAPESSVLGQVSGNDVGNAASFPTVNTFSSEVNDEYKDDHSWHVDATTVIKPPQPHWPHWRRDDAPASALGGARGDDIGNVADIPTVNTFSSEVNDEYHDDHSWDIDATTVINPSRPHWRRGNPPANVLGGASGDDIGNAANIPTVNDFSSEVTDSYADDHSLDVDSTFIVKPHHKRAGPANVLGGASGDDVGSSAFIPTVNEFSSSYEGHYNDDHSVDVDATTIIKPPSHPALGFHHPMHHARGTSAGDDIGPDGSEDDIGLEAVSSTLDAIGESGPNGPSKRAGPADGLGGASGDDIGNVADIPTVNSFSSVVDDEFSDDHSLDFDSTFVVKPHKARAVRPEGNVLGGASGDDIGNGFSAPTVNSVNTAVNDAYDDDHHVDVDSTAVISPPAPERPHWGQPHYEGHGEQQPAIHSAPQPPAPAHGEEKPVVHSAPQDPTPAPAPAQEEEKPAAHAPPDAASPQGDCTKVHQVVHTVTATSTAVETHTAMAYPQASETHGANQESAPSQVPAAGTPANTHGKQQEEASDPVPSGASTVHDSNQEDLPYPYEWQYYTGGQSGYPGYPSSQTPGQTPAAESSAATESTTTAPANNAHGSQMMASAAAAAQPTPPSGAYHAPDSSALYAAEATSFSKIPVYVPQPSGTPRAHGSAVAVAVASSSAAMSTPASSAYRVHGAHVPTGASPEHNARASSSAVASPSSSHGAMTFDGAAGRLGSARAMGVASVLAGVAAVLAFAL
ncbi:putative GPI anchored protein [Aspergillus undulatus]|uniref:putative GPI anchored protein n=1 Tax=Aspergillus undulatus TaxID=1810928 RepID=UPI003CCE3CA1